MRKLILALCLAVGTVIPLSAQTDSTTQPSILEVRISSEGMLESIVIAYGMWDLYLSPMGYLSRIETSLDATHKLPYSFSETNIAQPGSLKNELLYYESGRLKKIGPLEITYNPTYREKIDRLGNLEIGYRYSGGKLDQVEKAGELKLLYEFPKMRFDCIGNQKIEYNYLHRIDKLRSIAGKSELPAGMVITISHPLPMPTKQ